jgi:predicted deacetylase
MEAALGLCTSAGVRAALLVVPNYHGECSLLGDRGFCERLRDLQARGHDLYLHGFFHLGRERDDPRVDRGLARYAAQRLLSNREAELVDLAPDEGRHRVVEGERVLREAGLRVDGYVAPAWSMPRWLLPFLAERGCGFTEDHLWIYDPARRHRRASLLLNWASRSPARLLSTVGWCRAARHAGTLVPTRIAIHPGDMRFSLLRREVAETLAWARGSFVERAADLFD